MTLGRDRYKRQAELREAQRTLDEDMSSVEWREWVLRGSAARQDHFGTDGGHVSFLSG